MNFARGHVIIFIEQVEGTTMPEDGNDFINIARSLSTSFIGRRVIYYRSLASTMDAAREEARRGVVEGTVIIADEQTAGRGRMKRAWLTPSGNIALSVILRPALAHLPYLVMLASLSVAHSIEALTGLKTQIKWPNDVLVNGRKVCGILIESDVRGDAVNYAVIGIGINVSLRPAGFPGLPATTSSIAAEAGKNVSREELVRRLLIEMERMYLTLPDAEPIYQEWRDRMVTLGRKVQVKSGEETFEGLAEFVCRDGSLLLRRANGELSRVIAGDVTLTL